MNRTIALIFIIPLGIFAINEWYLRVNEIRQPTQPTTITIATKTSNTEQPHQEPTIAPVLHVATPINYVSDASQQHLYNTGALPERLIDTVFIEFELDTLKSLQPGDSFVLLIPHTVENYTVEIIDIIEASNGDRSIFGKVNSPLDHQAVFTLSNNNLSGQLSAANADYIFASSGQFGWISKL
ncbi:hypothetical protein [Pseudoalteromonas mariniglutinosa]|uniref:hypothetical protein n=1 Tax=Pseudoalteromonas mariniglutinosa TaxID=206042 RepID=UPI003850E2CA